MDLWRTLRRPLETWNLKNLKTRNLKTQKLENLKTWKPKHPISNPLPSSYNSTKLSFNSKFDFWSHIYSVKRISQKILFIAHNLLLLLFASVFSWNTYILQSNMDAINSVVIKSIAINTQYNQNSIAIKTYCYCFRAWLLLNCIAAPAPTV